MQTKVKLSEIVDGMDCWSDEVTAYLDTRTGRVVTAMEDGIAPGEWDKAAEIDGIDQPLQEQYDGPPGAFVSGRDVLADQEHYLSLPSKFDIHEYAIMERFCLAQEDQKVSNRLCQAIQGSGAFRRFKVNIHELGIADQWYQYRQASFKEIAIEWCESHGLPYTDDLPNVPAPEECFASRKTAVYGDLEARLREWLKQERDFIANAATLTALLYQSLPNINWAGCYILRGDELVLGPFQGQPACTRIALGKGVCGQAAAERQTVLVEDVSKFPGYIACHRETSAEIVLPISKEGRLLGVLDLDSPLLGRFDAEDQAGLERLLAALVSLTEAGD
jgi:GAF domain-containing protein